MRKKFTYSMLFHQFSFLLVGLLLVTGPFYSVEAEEANCKESCCSLKIEKNNHSCCLENNKKTSCDNSCKCSFTIEKEEITLIHDNPVQFFIVNSEINISYNTAINEYFVNKPGLSIYLLSHSPPDLRGPPRS